MNVKVKYLLTCDSAKEIWDRLQVLHEGTDQVKETKISMLVHQYEMFKMLEHENIDEMATRFMYMINQLKVLAKDIQMQKWLERS